MVGQIEVALTRNLPILTAPALNTLTRTTEWYSKALLSLQGEVVRFTSARIESDVALGRSLVNCRSWTDAAKLQQDWVSTLYDYIDETNRLIRLATGLEGRLVGIAREQGEVGLEAASEMARSSGERRRRTMKEASARRPRRRAS